MMVLCYFVWIDAKEIPETPDPPRDLKRVTRVMFIGVFEMLLAIVGFIVGACIHSFMTQRLGSLDYRPFMAGGLIYGMVVGAIIGWTYALWPSRNNTKTTIYS